jgi:hypothetical protein
MRYLYTKSTCVLMSFGNPYIIFLWIVYSDWCVHDNMHLLSVYNAARAQLNETSRILKISFIWLFISCCTIDFLYFLLCEHLLGGGCLLFLGQHQTCCDLCCAVTVKETTCLRFQCSSFGPKNTATNWPSYFMYNWWSPVERLKSGAGLLTVKWDAYSMCNFCCLMYSWNASCILRYRLCHFMDVKVLVVIW